ncbi:hypothetical protein [Lacticaseibacillus thailandensis]|uniref:hypothetical protein n=1 Tax=Lacticaseibacillus thailandensis TaxID=381741 RepID=UPI0006D1B110|nr:hypothetical protein [Lacticaseibacillus thailandensis]
MLEFEDGNEANIIGKREVPLSRRAIERFARFRSPFNHPTVMFRKKAILALGGYERLDFLEDYLLWAKLIATGAVVTNCPDVLLLMRSGANLYGRRGGMKYFRNYCLLRRKLHSMGIINSFQVIIGDFAVLSSSLVPTYVRGLLYKKILHKG